MSRKKAPVSDFANLANLVAAESAVAVAPVAPALALVVPTGPMQRALNILRKAAIAGGTDPGTPTDAEVAAAKASAAKSYAAHREKGGAGDLSPAAEAACASRRAEAVAMARRLDELAEGVTNPMAIIGLNKVESASFERLLEVGRAPAPKKASRKAAPATDEMPVATGPVVPVAPPRPATDEADLAGLLEDMAGLSPAMQAKLLKRVLGV